MVANKKLLSTPPLKIAITGLKINGSIRIEPFKSNGSTCLDLISSQGGPVEPFKKDPLAHSEIQKRLLLKQCLFLSNSNYLYKTFSRILKLFKNFRKGGSSDSRG